MRSHHREEHLPGNKGEKKQTKVTKRLISHSISLRQLFVHVIKLVQYIIKNTKAKYFLWTQSKLFYFLFLRVSLDIMC